MSQGSVLTHEMWKVSASSPWPHFFLRVTHLVQCINCEYCEYMLCKVKMTNHMSCQIHLTHHHWTSSIHVWHYSKLLLWIGGIIIHRRTFIPQLVVCHLPSHLHKITPVCIPVDVMTEQTGPNTAVGTVHFNQYILEHNDLLSGTENVIVVSCHWLSLRCGDHLWMVITQRGM